MLSNITTNGNLTFALESGDIDQVELMLERHGGNDEAFLVDMLDHFGFTPNGRLYAINPEDVGALTSAPLIADDVDDLECGGRDVRGAVWWYPAYELRNFAEVLAREGTVTFSKAH